MFGFSKLVKPRTTTGIRPPVRASRIATVFIVLSLLSQVVIVRASSSSYTYTMSYTFENRGSEPQTLINDDVSFPYFNDTAGQTVRVVSVTPEAGPTYLDEDGNRLAQASMSLIIQPGKNSTFTVVYQIDSSDRTRPVIDESKSGTISDIPGGISSSYLAHTTTFQSGNPQIASLAESLTENQPTVLAKLLRLVHWLNANITYDSYEVPRFANETLTGRKGDCDDQAILLISMLRSIGVPSYLELGVVFGSGYNDKETIWYGHLGIDERGLGWHGWAMVYVPPWGWLPVDLTLIRESDPLDAIRNAPEYGASVVSALRISGQNYIGESRSSRARIIASTIYVTSRDVATTPSGQPWWLYPAVAVLGVAVAGSVAFMFYSARRKPAPEQGQTI